MAPPAVIPRENFAALVAHADLASTIEEYGSPLKSTDTSSSFRRKCLHFTRLERGVDGVHRHRFGGVDGEIDNRNRGRRRAARLHFALSSGMTSEIAFGGAG